MKVKCVERVGCGAITYGKIYEVKDRTSSSYIIINDNGDRSSYGKERFILVEQIEEYCEENIDRILKQALKTTDTSLSWLNGLSKLIKIISSDQEILNDFAFDEKQKGIGLFKLLPSIFEEYSTIGHENIKNGVDNTIATINYISNKYGNVYNICSAIKEVHTYSGSEILQQVEEGQLIEDDILIDKKGEENSVYDILETDAMALKDYAPYTIKKREVALSFSEILDEKYDNKPIKCVHKLMKSEYSPLYGFLIDIGKTLSNVKIRQVLNEGKFYVKED